MTISIRDAEYLLSHGFTRQEVKAISEAVTPSGEPQPPVDLSGNVWQIAIKERQAIVEQIQAQFFRDRGREISKRQQDMIINQWYAQGLVADIWDWIKDIYRRGKKINSQVVREAGLRIQGLKRRINRG